MNGIFLFAWLDCCNRICTNAQCLCVRLTSSITVLSSYFTTGKMVVILMNIMNYSN